MSISIDLFKSQLDPMIDAVDKEMSDWRRYLAVQTAVAKYSIDKPDTYTTDVTGDGGRYYVVTTILNKWVEEFSQIIRIEYPAPTIASDEVPVDLDPEDWDDSYWQEVTGTLTRYLFLPRHSPAATETFRVTFTRPYVWVAGGTEVAVNQDTHGLSANDFIYYDGSDWIKTPDNTYEQAHAQATTITDGDNFKYKTLYTEVPRIDFFAVCDLAACIACQWLAAKYAKATDTTMGADSSTHTTRTSEFANRSKEYCKSYKEHVGLDQERPHGPAGQFVSWETMPSHRSRTNWIFHQK